MGNVGLAYRKQALKRLTDKESKFVLQYVLDMNATQAAIRAGYNSDHAQAVAQMIVNQINDPRIGTGRFA
jgi:phage terminase small subunit